MDKQLNEIEGRVSETPPMDPALKALWIRELRSGRYRQTKCHFVGSRTVTRVTGIWPFRRCLTSVQVEFCALGVLMRFVGPHHFEDALSGLKEIGVDGALYMQVTRWNDCDGLSFAEIADRLEAM